MQQESIPELIAEPPWSSLHEIANDESISIYDYLFGTDPVLPIKSESENTDDIGGLLAEETERYGQKETETHYQAREQLPERDSHERTKLQEYFMSHNKNRLKIRDEEINHNLTYSGPRFRVAYRDFGGKEIFRSNISEKGLSEMTAEIREKSKPHFASLTSGELATYTIGISPQFEKPLEEDECWAMVIKMRDVQKDKLFFDKIQNEKYGSTKNPISVRKLREGIIDGEEVKDVYVIMGRGNSEPLAYGNISKAWIGVFGKDHKMNKRLVEYEEKRESRRLAQKQGIHSKPISNYIN